MPESPVERKLVLPPSGASALIKQLRRELPTGADLSPKEILDFWEQHGAQLLSYTGQIDGVQEIEFSTGETAKSEKLAAGMAGNIFVQHGIALASGNTEARLRIALSHQSPDHHTITTGGSILTSGDIRKPPAEALRKLRVDPQLPASAFEQLGLGLSDLHQTGGIPYLFLVTRGHLLDTMTVTALGEDKVTMVDADVAEAAIAQKKLELAVLQRMRMGS